MVRRDARLFLALALQWLHPRRGDWTTTRNRLVCGVSLRRMGFPLARFCVDPSLA